MPAVRGAKRARSVRSVATDLDLSHGDGPGKAMLAPRIR
jgi:hypothetical protein